MTAFNLFVLILLLASLIVAIYLFRKGKSIAVIQIAIVCLLCVPALSDEEFQDITTGETIIISDQSPILPESGILAVNDAIQSGRPIIKFNNPTGRHEEIEILIEPQAPYFNYTIDELIDHNETWAANPFGFNMTVF